MKDTPETPEKQIEKLKIQSYDAWVQIQIANQTVKENQAKMMKNANKIAELESQIKTEIKAE